VGVFLFFWSDGGLDGRVPQTLLQKDCCELTVFKKNWQNTNTSIKSVGQYFIAYVTTIAPRIDLLVVVVISFISFSSLLLRHAFCP